MYAVQTPHNVTTAPPLIIPEPQRQARTAAFISHSDRLSEYHLMFMLIHYGLSTSFSYNRRIIMHTTDILDNAESFYTIK